MKSTVQVKTSLIMSPMKNGMTFYAYKIVCHEYIVHVLTDMHMLQYYAAKMHSVDKSLNE